MESKTVKLNDNQWTVNMTDEGFVATNAVQRIVAPDLETLQVELRKQPFDTPRQDYPRRDAVVHPEGVGMVSLAKI